MAGEEINELIKRISKQDEKALEILFNKTKRLLYKVAIEYLDNKSYVEDVLSEGYLKIYKKSKLFKEDYNGYNWMYEIIKNTSIDYNRRHKKENRMEEYDERLFNLVRCTKGEITKQDIRQAMKVLDEREYKIVYLRIWENKTLQVIAEGLKFSVSKVYRIYRDALEKLKKVLE